MLDVTRLRDPSTCSLVLGVGRHSPRTPERLLAPAPELKPKQGHNMTAPGSAPAVANHCLGHAMILYHTHSVRYNQQRRHC
jgi:hypothetical protein